MVLDVVTNTNYGINSYFSNIDLTSDVDINVEVWYARLGYIG